jgi:hypothetical protein
MGSDRFPVKKNATILLESIWQDGKDKALPNLLIPSFGNFSAEGYGYLPIL